MNTTRHGRQGPHFRGTAACSRKVSARGGFTLVEILVVIGIIVVLIGILAPAIATAYRKGVRARMTADIQALVTALEAYRQDHGDIPRVSPDGSSAVTITPTASKPATDDIYGDYVLTRAMVGVGDEATDGAAGPGFRTRPAVAGVPQGKIYGPYIPADKFKLVVPDLNFKEASSAADRNFAVLADSGGRPFLYYPGVKNADPAAVKGYVWDVTYGMSGQPRPMFNSLDNSLYMKREKLQIILGDTATAPAPNDSYVLDTAKALNGQIDPPASLNPQSMPEVAAYVGDYLILGAGPDGKYGPDDATHAINGKNPCDDVANFDR